MKHGVWVLLLVLTGIFLFIFFLYKSPAWSQISALQHASHADYFFVRDRDNQEWVFKQIVDPAPDDQVVIILEKFASEISSAVDIPLNFVKLVSASEDFSPRIFSNLPGSLHLKVPGEAVGDILCWDGLDIHQKFRTPFQIAKNGPLLPEEIGLRKEVIANMAKHPDLAKIVAIDTFLGNNDRSISNIFYNPETNSFYGIDMGSCLMGNLAKEAIEKLSSKTSFSEQEMEGLKSYRQALVSLISDFPPETTISLLTGCLEEAGFVSTNSLLWSEDLERKVKKWNALVNESYDSSKELASLLQTLIEGRSRQR